MFQRKIIEKYISQLDQNKLKEKYEIYSKKFLNADFQNNIRKLKEEQYQEGFIRDLFCDVLGYTIKPELNYNILTELKNDVKNKSNAKKSDGAICEENNENNIKAVIELKGTDTTDLDKVAFQGFSYRNFHKSCKYVIVSNFERLRFYLGDFQGDFIEFNLFRLIKEQFDILYLLLEVNNLKNDIPEKLKNETLSEEKAITNEFYSDYSTFKRLLFEDIKENNPEIDKLLLFKKTQKLLDRILFIRFCADRHLLPENSVLEILNSWQNSKQDMFSVSMPLYDYFKRFFNLIDKGFENKQDASKSIFAYNGGLFKTDETLDNIKIGDDVLYIHTNKLAQYDFNSQISVDILGRIFENSLTEIEEVEKEIEAEKNGEKVENNNIGKRKKDGVFYTPEYITKYIVENTIGKLCEEKKTELKINDEEYSSQKKYKQNEIEELEKRLTEYRNYLFSLKILDCSCGSGAFLNSALHELKKEHSFIDRLFNKIHSEALNFETIENDNSILENNLYGVDINEDSVEITKLSLWLHTAKKNRKLTTLNGKIKVGNSLIDDETVAGEKAFKWEEEFSEVFGGNSRSKGLKSLVQSVLSTVNDIEKGDVIYHVTTATHNSRYSEKILFFNDGSIGKPVNLDFDEEVFVMQTIAKIIAENKYKVLAYNFCKDHLHFLVACKKEELPKIMQKIKGITSLERNRKFNPTDRQLWQQKYFEKVVYNDEYLENTIHYILNNRKKHGLKEFTDDDGGNSCGKGDSDNGKGLKSLEKGENKCGFDVIIGNPPYVNINTMPQNHEFFKKNYDEIHTGYNDLMYYFLYKGINLLNENGVFGVITSNYFMGNEYAKKIRLFLNKKVERIVNFHDTMIFHDANVHTTLIFASKNPKTETVEFYTRNEDSHINSVNLDNSYSLSELKRNELTENWIIADDKDSVIIKKLNLDSVLLGEISEIAKGAETGKNGIFSVPKKIIDDNEIESEIVRLCIKNGNIRKYQINLDDLYLIYTDNNFSQQNFPKAFEYLETFKESLLDRRGPKNNEYEWWRLHRPSNKEILDAPEKLVVPYRAEHNRFAYDNKQLFNDGGDIRAIVITNNNYSIKYVLALLNSNLLDWHFGFIGKTKGKAREYFNIPLSQIPIKNISLEAQQPFIEKADKMLSFNESLQKKVNSFITVLKSEYNLEKISTKLENFFELDNETFLKELKTKLSLKQKSEVLEFFESAKSDIIKIKDDINKTDNEINKMVYELYGLTEEEIRRIEN